MVRYGHKLLAPKIVLKLIDGPVDCQGFLSYYDIILFGFRELTAQKEDGCFPMAISWVSMFPRPTLEGSIYRQNGQLVRGA